jgi:hypothetical protein
MTEINKAQEKQQDILRAMARKTRTIPGDDAELQMASMMAVFYEEVADRLDDLEAAVLQVNDDLNHMYGGNWPNDFEIRLGTGKFVVFKRPKLVA